MEKKEHPDRIMTLMWIGILAIAIIAVLCLYMGLIDYQTITDNVLMHAQGREWGNWRVIVIVAIAMLGGWLFGTIRMRYNEKK